MIVSSENVLIDGKFKKAFIHIEHGKITEILDSYQGAYQDYGRLHIIPGLVDTHVHINEPGRTDWEGFETATKAAAAGGITTLVDMPLNCIPVTNSSKNFHIKLENTHNKLFVNCAFWGGLTSDSIEELDDLLRSGVIGVKSFMIDSGIPEFKFMKEKDLREALPILAKYQLPFIVHAELDDLVARSVDHTYQSFLDSRPRTMENYAIEILIDLCREFQTPIHIVHLSSSDALPKIQKAKEEGLPLTAETCPHYLCLESENIEDGNGVFKCCPPIREKENQEKLWKAVRSGLIDFIVSDHSPCTAGLKKLEEKDLAGAWGGISSLQFTLPVVWSKAKERGFDFAEVVRLMAKKTAKFVDLKNKGEIKVGNDADLVVINPGEKFIISSDLIEYKNKICPYEGSEVFGKVHTTFVNGDVVYSEGKFSEIARGKAILKRKEC